MRQCVYIVILLALLVSPPGAAAQESRALAVTAGAAGGAASGVIVTMGWIVKRATIDQRYLHDPGDIFGIIGTPLIAFPATGVALALLEPDLLGVVGAGAGLGTLAGGAGGLVLGHVFAGGRTGRWAGMLMGAAAGLMAGAIIGAVEGMGELDSSSSPSGVSPARLPLALTVRF